MSICLMIRKLAQHPPRSQAIHLNSVTKTKQNAIILRGGRRICGRGEKLQATSVDERTSNQNSAITCFSSNFVSHRYGVI